MALLILLILLTIAASTGRAILALLRTVPDDRTERVTTAAALGLGVIAYLILGMGMVGLLRLAPVIAVLAIVAAAGLRGLVLLANDLRRPRVIPMPADISVGEAPPDSPFGEVRWLKTVCALALSAAGVLAAISCFVPPSAHEWDALAYHLAAPKVYLAHERIIFLPTDHHSNFPFLVQMLFTLGLVLNGVALANLFHFACWALTLAALVAIGRRHFGLGAGWIAAVVFAVTPLALWEAGAAYVEHGMTLFVLLSVGSALEYRRTGEPKWLGLAGILMGFALATKTLALVPAASLFFALLVGRARFKQLRWYMLGALVAGCPFYIKTWAWTGDPVYPFGYRLFHGKYWSEDLAQAYAGEQQSFGLHRTMVSAKEDWANAEIKKEPRRLSDRAANTLLAPFSMISVPRIFYNYNDPGAFNHLGYLFLALPPLLIFAPRARNYGAVGLVAGVGVTWYLVSVQTMQYARYFLPMVPLFGLLGGAGVVRLGAMSRILAFAAAFAIGLQAYVVLGYFAGQTARKSETIAGEEARRKYLETGVNHYASTQWLNANAPKEAGVVLFEETRGFYLDRPYLWGNYFHSRYIPYENMHGGRDMADWFLGHGIQYALVNLHFSPAANSSPENRQRLREAVRTNTEAVLMLEWYGPSATGGEKWRTYIGEAIREGGAVIVPEASQRGVVVLEFRPSRPGITGDAKSTQAGEAVP